MASYYSIIRYVPNPISEECINMGVVVFGTGAPLFHFIGDWGRARQFGGESTEFLQRFAKQVTSKQLGIFADSGVWDEERLRSILGKWHNSIQFTPPRGSLQPPEALLHEVAGAFLRESELREQSRRTRLNTQVKSLFKRMNVLAKSPEGAKRHLVVTDFLIDRRTGLFAEFALKNTVFYVMETVDYRSPTAAGMAKFYETGAKALVLAEAREKLGRGTKRYVVYSAHTGDRSAIHKYLALLEAHANQLFNYESRRDLAVFGSLINKAAGRADLIQHS